MQQLVVQKTSKTSEIVKKPRNEELPDWVEQHWFRYTFVTTYIAFVGQTADPWDVPIKQSVKVMQKIWDATSSYEYNITTSTAIYHKVRIKFDSRMILIQIYFSDYSTPFRLVAQRYWIQWHHDPHGIF